ncbi:hypothetical protein Q1695_004370 [Nippostrongylus brasiliensis]|nr:hypothetical protein Q1695_004370 [Nippostrongylus brasiliensis]
MASMQLFVPLVVALSLEKILAYEEPKCVHQEKPTLCKLLLPLYKDTAELEVTLVKAALPDLSAAVSDAMQAVLEALSTTEKTKDGALAYPRLECVHKKNATLCEHLISAHIYNVEIEISLGKGAPEEIKVAVSNSRKALYQALSMLARRSVLTALKIALDFDITVLPQWKHHCRGKENDARTCGKVLRGLYHTTLAVVKAIMEVVRPKKKAAIEKAYEDFESSPGNKTDLVPELGRKVLAVLHQKVRKHTVKPLQA